jgi:formate dehydrogenase subunit delta
MSPDKLAYMANQIGRFFAHQPHEQAVASTADHLRRFWDPRMRKAILSAPAASADKLDPLVREAVERLRAG